MNDQVNQTNNALPSSIGKVVNQIAFSVQIEEHTVSHYVMLDASPKMSRQIHDHLMKIAISVMNKKPALSITCYEEKQGELLLIQYRYSGALVGADKIDWQELTDWLMTQALQRFSHE